MIRLRALAWLAALVVAGSVLAARPGVTELPPPVPDALPFTPPAEDAIPDTPLGAMVQFGRDVFTDTQRYAKRYVGNGLNCRNCHLDAGRRANAAPLWAAYVAYPSFRSKNDEVNTFAQRLQGCFRYSMNGKVPPADSAVIVGLTAYAHWLATGAPVGADLAGRGFPAVAPPADAPDAARGAVVYRTRCAECHGANGGGLKDGRRYTFPPLWGRNSYNAGAGMHRVHTAAGFIHAHMPLGQPDTLTGQEAWDVAAFINSKPRPPDPRLLRVRAP